MRDMIHFAHGNGFPALCYKQMLDALSKHFDWCSIDRIGHNPEFPVEDNWRHLVFELIDSIKRQAKQPIIALGHSLGGVLSLLAAIEAPELFKMVIMLDSPLIGPFKSHLVKLAKTIGFIDRMTPAFRTKGRRVYWKTREEVVQYLRSKDLFKSFTDTCLNDYIDYGMENKEDGYYLRFDSRIEYEIYRTVPHILSQFEKKLTLPATLIYGNKSQVVDAMDRRYMQRYFNIKSVPIEGTHLFPMEDPNAAAELIIQTINSRTKT